MDISQIQLIITSVVGVIVAVLGGWQIYLKFKRETEIKEQNRNIDSSIEEAANKISANIASKIEGLEKTVRDTNIRLNTLYDLVAAQDAVDKSAQTELHFLKETVVNTKVEIKEFKEETKGRMQALHTKFEEGKTTVLSKAEQDLEATLRKLERLESKMDKMQELLLSYFKSN